jgi:4-amino-4-deoxy-L-arabinose transferase-like glycosyltransferase
MYTLKSEVFPSFILVLMGSLDCLTTIIGVLYFGAAELNPFLTGIVSTSIWAFLAVKVSATFFIGFTYILANRILNKTTDKTTKSFKYSSKLLKVAYAGLVVFLIVVVANNLFILLS